MIPDLMEKVRRMRRVPGIDFVQDENGWPARVSGIGLEVREVINIYRGVDKNWDRLKVALHWFSDAQLQAALTYYELYPDEIDEYLAWQDAFDIEAFWEQYPQTRPRPRSKAL
ncbi:MAG: hypothetical protein ACR2PL_04360 [Dehalococcoidia bacterium]